jgi:anti-sigma-K factor RskA
MDLARPDRRARLDELAAQFVLGTLRGPAQRRFARAAASDPVVAAAVREWEQRLDRLAEAVPGVTPPPKVWQGIAARLGLDGAAQPGSWWQRLGFWRGFAVASFAAALVLSWVVLTGAPPVPGATLVVVLAGPDARPAMIATASRDEPVLTVKRLAGAAPPAGRDFELWALPPGAAPRSLGVLAGGRVARLTLPEPSGRLLANVPTLAVSVEPPGGSRSGAPTGPVVYTGAVERFY